MEKMIKPLTVQELRSMPAWSTVVVSFPIDALHIFPTYILKHDYSRDRYWRDANSASDVDDMELYYYADYGKTWIAFKDEKSWETLGPKYWEKQFKEHPEYYD